MQRGERTKRLGRSSPTAENMATYVRTYYERTKTYCHYRCMRTVRLAQPDRGGTKLQRGERTKRLGRSSPTAENMATYVRTYYERTKTYCHYRCMRASKKKLGCAVRPARPDRQLAKNNNRICFQ